MTMPYPVEIYFNFRSPYCYVAARQMFDLFERCNATTDWRPLGNWDGRSPPERAKVKVPLVRQDMKRICRRLNIPFSPPPGPNWDGTAAGAASLYAAEAGQLKIFTQTLMTAAWGQGRDISAPETVAEIAAQCGFDREACLNAARSPDNLKQLSDNAERATNLGVIGVPSFVVGEEIFWGQDRLDYLEEHLQSLNNTII